MARESNLLASIAAAATEATAEPTPAVPAPVRPPAVGPAQRRGRGAVPAYAERNRPHTMMLPVDLIKRLNDAVERTGRSKAELVRTAVSQYLDDQGL